MIRWRGAPGTYANVVWRTRPLKHIEASVRRRIDDAVSKARAGSQPSFEHALNDVYSAIADSV